MKKALTLLLSLCLVLSTCGALAEITQETIDAKYDPPINLTACVVCFTVMEKRQAF